MIDVPDFVKQNDRLHKMWVERWEQLVASSFEFSEVIIIVLIILTDGRIESFLA